MRNLKNILKMAFLSTSFVVGLIALCDQFYSEINRIAPPLSPLEKEIILLRKERKNLKLQDKDILEELKKESNYIKPFVFGIGTYYNIPESPKKDSLENEINRVNKRFGEIYKSKEYQIMQIEIYCAQILF